MTTNHKNVYTCQKTLYAAVLKHIVRATKLSYQKLQNARIKLACLIPFLPPQILAPCTAQDCLSHFPEYSPTVYSLFLDRSLTLVSSVVHYWCYSQHRFIDYLIGSSMVLVDVISEYITVAHKRSWWRQIFMNRVVQGNESKMSCDQGDKFNLLRTRAWNSYFTQVVVAPSGS